ncbi:sodium- and chloride-dependent glycine transporter 1-like [Danaus plexippus]|uniref:sodium- and chloride-dependent glycine transporter 1-like n=1 Tax=Danaus plexippus TaxID=13037 RepID=UPI002AAFDE39|nr:sodium- and chloride-dependent glycine transporter 1-like [Danaus plexippus]
MWLQLNCQMKAMDTDNDSPWGTQKSYIVIFICHFLGITNISTMPNDALLQGAFGFSIVLMIVYIIMGIPLLYVESIVGQFTSRDCIDVWRIRPCLSFIGYLLIIWQAFTLIYNHIVSAFLLHYFLISFETPIPFYTCGLWSTKFCNTLVSNYTVNLDCVKNQNIFPYCDHLYKTFPEYQYWRLNLVQSGHKCNFCIAWRVCLASGLNCIAIFLSCFKRSKSLKWVINIFFGFPILTLAILLMGSMRQQGLVAKYEDAIDIDFTIFAHNFRFSSVIQNVMFNLGIGSGLTFNLASSAPFRSPSFSNTVVTVMTCAVYTIIVIFTMAMVTCPYAFKYGPDAGDIIRTHMSFAFEKIPRLIYEYQDKMFYLIIIYTCFFIIAINSNFVLFYNLLEVIFKRNPKLAKYPGLTVFCASLMLYILTIPLLSYVGVNLLAYSFKRHLTLISTFVGVLECVTFVFWYGMNRFSEDINFMVGIRPNSFMKVGWGLSILFLIYSFCYEVHDHLENSKKFIYSTYTVLVFSGLIVIVTVVRLVIAAIKRRFREFIALDKTWGPKDEILQRSRGMFSAQAMTKEYIYRQYHLQAGILHRQRRSNIRSPLR